MQPTLLQRPMEGYQCGIKRGGYPSLGGPPAGEKAGPQTFHQIVCDLVRLVTSVCETDRNRLTDLQTVCGTSARAIP